MVIVSNASPLIYLAKCSKLHLLREVFEEVCIPVEVKHEVVVQGKKLGIPDAQVVEDAIKTGWIKIHETQQLAPPIRLDPGESASLSLAKNLGISEVLIDEAVARRAARMMGLIPRGTLYVLLESLKRDLLDFNGLLEALSMLIREGFRLKEEVYIEAVLVAQRIEKEKQASKQG